LRSVNAKKQKYIYLLFIFSMLLNLLNIILLSTPIGCIDSFILVYLTLYVTFIVDDDIS